MNEKEKRCYSVAELMVMLDVGRQSIYSLLKRREFSWVKLDSGIYRISKASFDQWLDHQETFAMAQKG